MKNRLYVLYNTLSNRYGEVRAFPSDGYAVNEVQKPLGEYVKNIELCRIGSIDIETGKVEAEPPVRIAWDDSILPVSEPDVK